jgi:hypothetical protein
MQILRARRVLLLIAATSTLSAWAATPEPSSASSAETSTMIEPSDQRLVPNPIEASDEGTAWACQAATGTDVRCTGALTTTWVLQDGPGDWCAVPLYSVNGIATRTQTRYYTYDAASDRYLERKRLIHLGSDESLTPDADPSSPNVVTARLGMTWISRFQTLGDLDSRVTRKQGIDTLVKSPNGGVVVLDVGQKTTVLGDDFEFKGRWDIALGDPAVQFGKICAALGR